MVQDFFHQQSVAYQPAHFHHLTNRGPNLDLWLVNIWQSFPGAKSLKKLHQVSTLQSTQARSTCNLLYLYCRRSRSMNKQGFIHLRVTIYVVKTNKWQNQEAGHKKGAPFQKDFPGMNKKTPSFTPVTTDSVVEQRLYDGFIFVPLWKSEDEHGDLCSTIVNPMLASLGQRYTMIHENNSTYVIHFRKIYTVDT